MEIAYLHLVTNHIPIIGVPFGLAVLLAAIWRNSDEMKALGFLIFVVLGAATVGVFLLGQGGEDFVEGLAGVSHDAIEDHEGFAKFGLASVLAVSVASVFALFRYGGFGLLRPRFRKVVNETGDEKRFPMWVVILVVALGLLSSGILGYTGRLGGKIRHPEFHQGSPASNDLEDGDSGEGRRRRGRNRGER